MKINANFKRKDDEIRTTECIIEHVEFLSNSGFNYFSKNLLDDHLFIENNIDYMFYDGVQHSILAVNEETGDGILVDSSGSAYARYSSFVPKILPYIKEQVAMVCDKILSEMDKTTEFNLEEISQKYGLPLREGNGIVTLLAEQLQKTVDVEFYDDGVFEVTSKDEININKHNDIQLGGM